MRPRYWIKMHLFSFQLFSSVESSSLRHRMASLVCLLKCIHFLERFSLFIRASHCPSRFLLLCFSSWPQLLNHVYSFMSYLPTLKCWAPWEPRPQRNKTARLVQLVQSPHWEQCLERRKCSLNVHWLQEWGIFSSFVKSVSIMRLYFFYNESNKHFSILPFIFPPVYSHSSKIYWAPTMCQVLCQVWGILWQTAQDHTPSFLVLAFSNDSDLTLLKSAHAYQKFTIHAKHRVDLVTSIVFFKCYNSMKLKLCFVCLKFLSPKHAVEGAINATTESSCPR